MAVTTGLWQRGQETALQNYLKSMIAGCSGLCNSAQNIAAKMEGKDKNNDTEAIVSIMQAIVDFCNGQVDVIKDTVGEIIATEKKLEDEKGSQCGYADATQAVLNQLEKSAWKEVTLEVGGLQATEEDLAEVSASFKPLRDEMSELLKDSKAKIEEIEATDATFADALVEVHTAMSAVFHKAVETLNVSNRNFSEIRDDVSGIMSGFKSKAGDTAGQAKTSAMNAEATRKGIQPVADSIF